MDLISRQAAIEIVKRYDKSHMALKQRPMLGAASIVMELEDLPSAQPEQRWIPCSERLPEEYGEFLVTMTEKAKAKDLGFDIDETYVRKMRYNSNGWQLPRHIPSWINEAVKDEVLAWMPLPEPWRGDSICEYIDTGKYRLSAPINGSWNVMNAYPYKESDAER